MPIKGFWHVQDSEFNQKVKKNNEQKRSNLCKKGGSPYTKTEHTTLEDEIKVLKGKKKIKEYP